jgi:hypothetical protein|tara:strand:- start:186 stop:425 length:240 start_codon:yes stop_codon:yes gene_type:complete
VTPAQKAVFKNKQEIQHAIPAKKENFQTTLHLPPAPTALRVGKTPTKNLVVIPVPKEGFKNNPNRAIVWNVCPAVYRSN